VWFALNQSPEFSGEISDELNEILEEEFPEATQMGKSQERWKP